MLQIKGLRVHVGSKEVLQGVDLLIRPGEVHAIMGPNGAGKTSLALSIMGHPNYKFQISDFRFQIDGKNMIPLTPEQRAAHGLFVSFQQPVEITGVSILAFLRTAHKALYPDQKIPLSQFKADVQQALERVSLPPEFMNRSLNEGFSGGEKKRAEVAQLLVLKPKFAILDEIDSGLDVDSLRIVAKAVREIVKKMGMGILLITHYQRILHHVKPDYVHVLIDGRIKKSDGMALVETIEKDGYAAI